MGAIARSDIELVEASLRGEHEAFGHLVARYQDVVCAVSYSSTGDQVLSEDVAQDTFIAAWRQLDRLRNSARLRPWLCGIARNLARTARKRRRREPPVDDADKQIAPGASPFDAAARGDVERIVRDALARIPDAYREVLVLYYREDQSIREVADALGVSETTVMQRLSRGRRYLADSVTELVERSLRSERRHRDLVAAVLASIAALVIPSRVDASPAKGSTMLKFAIGASALVVAGTTAYFVHAQRSETTEPAAATPTTLHYGAGRLGLAHAPSLGLTAAPRAIQSRNVAQADLALLPADSDAVIGINFAKVRGSALWQRYIAPKLAGAGNMHELDSLCGFDPLTSLGSISLGLKGIGAGDHNTTGVIVVHGFDKTKAMSCFDRRGVGEAEKDGSKVTIDGDVVLITDANDREHLAFTFIDTTTALVVIGADAKTKQGVERIATGNSGLQTSSTFAESLQAINTDDSLWMVLADGSSIMKVINGAIEPITSIKVGTAYVSVDVTDTLALDTGLRLGSPETAAKLVSTIQAKMAENPAAHAFTRYFDQLDVVADGSDLIVSFAMSADQIAQLISSFATLGSLGSM